MTRIPRMSASWTRKAPRSQLWAALLSVMMGMVAIGAPATAENASNAFCADPMSECGGLIQENCLERLGAASISVAEAQACRSQVDKYRSCVSRIARECGSTTQTGGQNGAGSNTKVYCQRQTDSCLSAINDDYRECRDASDSDCRADCREERDFAREACNDSLRTCLATGSYSTASFVFPSCAAPKREERRAEETTTPIPGPMTPMPSAAAGGGMICRNGMYYCFMFTPGPVGAPCSCTGNPAMGVPPFQGMISPQ